MGPSFHQTDPFIGGLPLFEGTVHVNVDQSLKFVITGEHGIDAENAFQILRSPCDTRHEIRPCTFGGRHRLLQM